MRTLLLVAVGLALLTVAAPAVAPGVAAGPCQVAAEASVAWVDTVPEASVTPAVTCTVLPV